MYGKKGREERRRDVFSPSFFLSIVRKTSIKIGKITHCI